MFAQFLPFKGEVALQCGMANGGSNYERVELLLQDYAQARDDERYYTQQQGNLLSIGFAALGALFLIAQQLVSKPHSIPNSLVAAAPLVVMAFLYYAQYISSQSVIRGFYLRALEREIRTHLSSGDRKLSQYSGLPILSLSELITGYVSQSRSRQSFGIRVLNVVFIALVSVFGALITFFALQVPLSWRILMLLTYGAGVIVLLIENDRTLRSGRSFFSENVRILQERLQSDLTPAGVSRQGDRSLGVYLLIPRPDDLFLKGGITLAGVALALLVDSGNSLGGWRGLVVFVGCFEYFAYQARYQWNDIRGVKEDEASTAARLRRRLPGGRRAKNPSAIAMLVRVGLIFWGAAFIAELPSPDGRPLNLLIVSGLVFFLAVPYEWLKSRMPGRGCGRVGLVGLVFVLSLGYPLRFLAGWLAAGGSVFGATLLWILLACCFLGVLLVLPAWLLEFFSYVTARDGDRFMAIATVANKPHLITLSRGFGLNVGVLSTSATKDSMGLDGSHIPLGELPTSTPSPFHVATAAFQFCILMALPISDGNPAAHFDLEYLLPFFCALIPLRRSAGLIQTCSATAVSLCLVLFDDVHQRSWPSSGTFLLSFAVVIPAMVHFAYYPLTYAGTRDLAGRIWSAAREVLTKSYLWFINE